MRESDSLAHYGTPRHSGRYPWGSGDTPYQRATNFLNETKKLRQQGLKETEIAEYFGMNTTQLRARSADMKTYKKQKDMATALKLSEKGVSVAEIARRLDCSPDTAKKLLDPTTNMKRTKIEGAHDILKKQVDEHKYIDFGKGTETILGVSTTQLNTAVQQLKDEGYVVHEAYIKQLGVKDATTTVKVMCPPGTTKQEFHANRDKIRVLGVTVDQDGYLQAGIKPPTNIDSNRIQIRYGDEGGSQMDGVIELRPGVKDLSIGSSHYAQVRIAVDGTHYIKGVAIYSDDLPKGVDIRVNSNKTREDAPNKLDALKKFEKTTNDPSNPFGATIKRQQEYIDKDGKTKLSALNIVNEEGDWDKWSRSLAPQMLSKQMPSEAKKQLKITRDKKEADYNELMSLENPVVRRKLLQSFADSCDSKAVEMKAAAYPRQASQLILPLTKIKDTEVYAPNFKHGEKVALIRYPHAGTFEIPVLTVNNRNAQGISVIGKKAMDAIGIHPNVAERLSGADFDGDSVVVIPNNNGQVKSSPALRGLKGYDPKIQYKYHEGVKVLPESQKQRLMGEVSNLITDMTIRGADANELAKAVRHSMTVIDATKHKLDWKQSEIDNDIKSLKKTYQPEGGASTLISRSKSPTYVPQRRLRKASEGGPIDPETGKKVWVETGDPYKKSKVPRLGLYDDAATLSSGSQIEKIYADHSNAMKALANKARKASLAIEDIKYSPQARKDYAPEVASLKAKLNEAYRNKPLERQAQILANARVNLQKEANPDLSKKEIGKLETHALSKARASLGGKRYKIQISDREWEAVQKGALRTNMLKELVENTSADHLKDLSLPKKRVALSTSQKARAVRLLESHTTAEVAEALGVSTSTIRELVRDGD